MRCCLLDNETAVQIVEEKLHECVRHYCFLTFTLSSPS